MKHRIGKEVLPVLIGAALLLAGCGTVNEAVGGTEPETAAVQTESLSDTAGTNDMFSSRDLDPDYDESQAISIQLTGNTAVCNSDTVTVDGGTVTITAAGTYILSGTLTDGQIVVRAGEADKVQLVLNDVDITCSDSAAVYAAESDKVFLTLADSSENVLTNGGTYTADGETNVDAVIFAKTDLTLNGAGNLTVNAAVGHGIVCKDDLVISGGNYTIDAANHGIEGRDSIRIATGSVFITAGKDGIHAENDDDAEAGWLYILDGNFTVNAQGDAISTASTLEIKDGTFELATGAGSSSVTLTSDADGFGMGAWGSWDEANAADDASVSCKGLKSGGNISVYGGTFNIDSVDDAIHASGTVEIADGDLSLRSGDDAIHSDSDVIIQGGDFDIPYCYEGVEGLSVTIDGGTLNIVSSDDGINTAGGADGSGFMADGGDFTYNAACSVVVGGGNITIASQGDCIDSNGDITVNGGTINLTCGGNGNTALDCIGTYTNNGGTVTTNDGSESGMGMGGPMGGQMDDMGGQLGNIGGQMNGGGPMGGGPMDGGQMGGMPPGGGSPDMGSTDSSAAAA